MKMTSNLNKLCYEVRQHQETLTKIDDKTSKNSVTVTSSKFSQNDGTMRIFIHFIAKNHCKLPVTDKNLI